MGGALAVALLMLAAFFLFPNPAAGGAAAPCAGAIPFLSSMSGASCNLVRPLFSPGSGGDIVSMIRSARTSIDVEMYVFTDENLARELAAASARGVKVRVILEPRVSSNNLNAIAAGLQDGGVEVRWASLRYQLTHTKMMIVDGKEALVGSINFSGAAQNKNREVGVELQGPALEKLQDVFEQDWKDASVIRTASD
ncbi:Cardiolipin synthase A [uncultured archaeon]|nr:Cardiolipin synthase A [uncultured archaeon]